MKVTFSVLMTAVALVGWAAEMEATKGEGATVECAAPKCAGPACRPPKPGKAEMAMPGALEGVARVAQRKEVAEQLGLTEAQQAKLKELTGKSEAVKTLRDQERQARERQLELLRAETIDEAAVMAAVDAVFEARREMTKLQLKRVIAIKAVLTPEQLEKGMELLRQRESEKIERWGKKPIQPPPPAPAPAAPVEG